MNDLDDSDFLAHHEAPYHRGRLPTPADSAHARNPVCGDWVVLDALWGEDGSLAALHFEAQGCVVCQVAASILCLRVEGLRADELGRIGPLEVLSWIDIPLMPRRRRCALLPFEALREIVERRLG